MLSEKVNPGVVMIDYQPSPQSDRIIRSIVPDTDELLSKALGEKYKNRGEIKQEFEGVMMEPSLWYQIYREYPEIATIYAALDGFLKNHSELVTIAMQHVWRRAGTPDKKPYQIPSQTVTDINIEFDFENPDNPIVFMGIDPDLAIEAISKARRQFPDLSVLNLSLLMGKMGYQFEIDEDIKTGNRGPGRPKMLSPYAKDRVFQNLPQLLPICHAHSDMVVVAAGGNWGEDIREVRRLYESSWPTNLIIAVSWSGPEKRNNFYEGADIFVEGPSRGMSSLSTGMTSVLAEQLESKNLCPEEKIDWILSQTEIRSDGYKTLDIDRAISHMT